MWIFGQSGIIKANIRTYFKARKKGLSVDEALSWVIQSRYPESKEHQVTVAEEYLDRVKHQNLNTEEEKVVALVYEIVEYEDPTPTKSPFGFGFEEEEKLVNKITDTYQIMKWKR